jgi:F0F1-type ATP synthase assembly protein I
MSGRSKEDARAVRNRLIWEDAAAWIGRVFATIIFMVGPGVLGFWMDRQFGTKFLAAIGFVVGMVLGTTALLILANVKRTLPKGEQTGSDDTSYGKSDDPQEPT